MPINTWGLGEWLAFAMVAAICCWITVQILAFLSPLFVAIHGLFIAPITNSVKSLGDRYFIRTPHYVTHDEEEDSSHSGTRYQSVPDTYHSEPASSQPSRTSSEPPAISNELDLARHFATLQKPNGEYWLSANKIAAAVGGERESILAAIREIRGRQPIPGERVLRVKDAKGERAISWEA